MADSTWVTIDGDDIIPQAVTDALADLEPILQTSLIPLQTAQTTLDILAALIEALDTNPIQTLIGQLIDDLVQTQVSLLFIKPQFSRIEGPFGPRSSRYGGLGKFGRTLKAALTDISDFNRPTFDEADTSGGVIFMINAPSFAEISSLVTLFSQLFGDGWRDVLDLIAALPGQPVPFFRNDATGTITSLVGGESAKASFIDSTRISPNSIDLFTGTKIKMVTGLNTTRISVLEEFDSDTATFRINPPFDASNAVGDAYVVSEFVDSRPPDWKTVRLVDVIPPLRRVVRVLQELRDLLEPPVGLSKLLLELTRVIQRKILRIQLIINQIQELITLLQNLGSVTNVNMLPIPFDIGGNGRFIQEFADANNPPPVDDDNVSLGLVVYGGAGTTAIMQTLFPQLL